MITVNKSNGILTLNLQYQGEEVAAEELLGYLTEDLWVTKYGDVFENGELVSVETLTNEERLALINRFVKDEFIARAKRMEKREAREDIDSTIDQKENPFEGS